MIFINSHFLESIESKILMISLIKSFYNDNLQYKIFGFFEYLKILRDDSIQKYFSIYIYIIDSDIYKYNFQIQKLFSSIYNLPYS